MFNARITHRCKLFSLFSWCFPITKTLSDIVMNHDNDILYDSIGHNNGNRGISVTPSTSDDADRPLQQQSPNNFHDRQHLYQHQHPAQSCSSRGSSNNNAENFGVSRQNLVSSIPTLDYDSMTDVVIDDIADEPTSAILDYCKRKFLRPYVQILGLVGIRPMSVDTTAFQAFISHLQTVIIFTLLCIGYFLQYFASFRRDRGFNHSRGIEKTVTIERSGYKEAYDCGELLFVYIIPAALHVCGFMSAVWVFRMADNEQLQNLVERVFLMSNAPRKLCIALWMFVLGGAVWIGFLCAYVVLLSNAQSNQMNIQWYENPNTTVQAVVKVSLISTIFVHDLVQMIILISYCIECYLLKLHLYNLKDKLIQHTIETLDWMREVLEFRKLLSHLNQKVATPICFFTVLNLCYAFAGLIYLFRNYDFQGPVKIFSLSIANLMMWLILGLAPFFAAASVTRACKVTQASGHQIRVRPFVYHNTPSEDLDSTLMFASSLNMSAKLYRMPIFISYLCFSILIVSLVILTLGMCMNVSLGFI